MIIASKGHDLDRHHDGDVGCPVSGAAKKRWLGLEGRSGMVSLIKPFSIKGCNTVVLAYEGERAMCSITSARVRGCIIDARI